MGNFFYLPALSIINMFLPDINQYLVLVPAFFVSIEMIGCFYHCSRRNNIYDENKHIEVLSRYDKKVDDTKS